MDPSIPNCRIYLRRDQGERDIAAHNKGSVGIFAPKWVEEGLEILGRELRGVTFDIVSPHCSQNVLESFTLDNGRLTLTELQKIARNEESNVSGIYAMTLYAPFSGNIGLIAALKDLVRPCIIVGRDKTTHYGGYPLHVPRKSQSQKVYICDLAALQFQQHTNTGRMVLIQSQDTVKGLLDDFIFKNVVGEFKISYDEVRKDTTGRYLKTHCSRFSTHECYFDVHAYRKFVAADVVLSALAVCQCASRKGDKVNFKFLKYGSGFFAGSLGGIVNAFILSGVVMGLEDLFSNHGETAREWIRHVEFPFYDKDPVSICKLNELNSKFGLEYSFSQDDALKATQPGLTTATTNCADSCVVIGNEMHFGSVDAAIAENLLSKGNIFCPILNKEIKEYFLDI